MNKVKIFAFLLAFICFGHLFVYGQKTEIYQENFLEAYNKMLKKTNKLSQRTTLSKKSWIIGSSRSIISKVIVEFIPSDKIRTVEQVGFKDNDKLPTSTIEFIIVGDTEYKKDSFNNIWSKYLTDRSAKPYRCSIFPKGVKNAKWYRTENVSIGDEVVDLYEEYIEIKSIGLMGLATNQFGERVYTSKNNFWITKDNLLIKSESSLNNNTIEADNFFAVYLYEYDPNIKIEVPIK